MSKKNLIPANKTPSYLIPENEVDFYHVRFTESIATNDPDIFTERDLYQTFTVAGFEGYVKNKSHFGYKSEVILHDPTYKGKTVVANQPEEIGEIQPSTPSEIQIESQPKPKPLPKARAKKVKPKTKKPKK